MELSPTKKRPKKIHVSVDEKQTILNIFKAFVEENPKAGKVAAAAFTAKAAGVCTRSVYTLLKEYDENHHFSPAKKYHRGRPILDNVTYEDKCAIRRIVHSFFFANDPPTVEKIMSKVNENEDLPNFKLSTFRKLLIQLNFCFKARQRNSILKEKPETIAWRRRYLRGIKKYREEGRPIYYLDETRINAGHTVGKVWMDKTVLTPRQAFNEGLSTGLKNPSGKGSRLIILHIGSDQGFVEDGLLLFQSKKTGDYHEDMNSEKFEEWFKRILPTLEPNAVIVMDNASYHSRVLEKAPTTSTRKAEIQEWLRNKGVFYEDDMVKAELLSLVNQNKPSITKYAVDEMAKEQNLTVLRLPPYHCELNPIELIWAQSKGFVARRNTTFKLTNVKVLFEEALKSVTKENWSSAVAHVLKVEKEMWQLDVIMEVQVEELIINVGQDSESDFDLSSEDDRQYF